MADQPQPLDSVPLIRRKRVGEAPEVSPPEPAQREQAVQPPPVLPVARQADVIDDAPLQMKPREIVQLTAVHVRIPEQIARGLRLMSVLEGRQAQVIVAEALEAKLSAWNPKWREAVPSKGG